MKAARNLDKMKFSSIGEELAHRERDANSRADLELVGEIKGVRYQIESFGLSPSSTKWVNETHGNKTVLGQFTPSNKGIGLAGFDVMKNVAQSTNNSIEIVYKKVIGHEILHRKIQEATGSELVNSLLTRRFDVDKVMALEEGVVSKETSEGIDAYENERAQVGIMASEIGTSRGNLSRIIITGNFNDLSKIITEENHPSINSDNNHIATLQSPIPSGNEYIPKAA